MIIAAQLAEARHAENALLGASIGADGTAVVSTAANAAVVPTPLGVAAATVPPKPKRASKPKQPTAGGQAKSGEKSVSKKTVAPLTAQQHPTVHTHASVTGHSLPFVSQAGETGGATFGGAANFSAVPASSTSTHTNAVVPQLIVANSLL